MSPLRACARHAVTRAYVLVTLVRVAMMLSPARDPYFRPGHVHLAQRRSMEAMSQCPKALFDKLTLNGLMPDEATDRQGNCGIDAFARSLMAQISDKIVAGPSDTARNRRNLKKSVNKVDLLRRVGVSWLETNASEMIWPSMTVAKLCCTVSGLSFHEYLAKMRQDREWVDTAFLHALGRAYGVNVVIFQAHMDEALVGEDLQDSAEHEDCIAVPVALVNDYHFWGVLPCADEVAVDVVDKGEPAALRSCMGDGRRGKGLCPNPRLNPEEKCGLEDGEPPEVALPHATPPICAAVIEAELQLCTALATWEPWNIPSAALLNAMDLTHKARAGAQYTPSIATTASRRAEAIMEIAYEKAHFDDMPPSLRYQRLARIRIHGCPRWQRHHHAQDILEMCNGIQSVEALTQSLHEGTCERHNKSHGPGNPHCQGMSGLTATMVYNWRVLWWSLPKVQRKEHVLQMFVVDLRAHRARGGVDERWRMQYTFLGQKVCRDAFLILSGLGCSTLQAARDAALAGKVSWSSGAERELHGFSMHAGSHNKAHGRMAYLGARAWLEWYAETHADMSPTKFHAYLPAGRKCFYYAHYRKSILERYGVTEEDATGARAYALACRKSKKRSADGHSATATAAAYAAAAARMADVPLAEPDCFMKAWRIECPWLIVCKSVSLFTQCSVCEYLRLLIDQTPRDQVHLRSALQARLGDHYDFQAAQRLAELRLEEECAHSGGRKWFMLIDKMDQQKTVCPTIWSQLGTKMFQDKEKRLVTGLIGSMWFGTRQAMNHVRTVFNDCAHGAEMQSSAILMNLHEVAMHEGHVPEEFHIGADNTPKETKNQYTFWFLMWLLSALDDTPLKVICCLFLLVGHTHNKLDRLFSRISVALRGKDYFTVEGLLRQVRETLLSVDLRSSHLSQVWNWKALCEGEMPGNKYRLHSLSSAHAYRFSRGNGIFMQWKQWATNETWSTPVQILSASEVATLKRWRPAEATMKFHEEGTAIRNWLGRLESWCASQPAGSAYLGLHEEFSWLRAAVDHTLPGTYAPGTKVDDILRDLQALPPCRPGTYAPGEQHREFPEDIVAQLYRSADVHIPTQDALVRIEGLTHNSARAAIRSTTLVPGSHILVAAADGTRAHGHALPIVVGQVVDTSCRNDTVLVTWYVPQLAPEANFRGGKKKQILDVFGPWSPESELGTSDMRLMRLPDPIVHTHAILEANFDFTENGTLPYDVFDTLRTRHSIDLTGFNASMTRHGNMYRSYVLMRGR